MRATTAVTVITTWCCAVIIGVRVIFF